MRQFASRPACGRQVNVPRLAGEDTGLTGSRTTTDNPLGHSHSRSPPLPPRYVPCAQGHAPRSAKKHARRYFIFRTAVSVGGAFLTLAHGLGIEAMGCSPQALQPAPRPRRPAPIDRCAHPEMLRSSRTVRPVTARRWSSAAPCFLLALSLVAFFCAAPAAQAPTAFHALVFAWELLALPALALLRARIEEVRPSRAGD